jgi:hypothetical protein
MIAIGERRHLQIADRWVAQYNFYINDRAWGRMLVRRSELRKLAEPMITSTGNDIPNLKLDANWP